MRIRTVNIERIVVDDPWLTPDQAEVFRGLLEERVRLMLLRSGETDRLAGTADIRSIELSESQVGPVPTPQSLADAAAERLVRCLLATG